jgi:hypothetical protein
MQITLYKAAEELRETLDQVDPETGELPEGYESILGLVKNKGQAVIAYRLNELATVEMIKAHIKDMQAKAKSIEKRCDHLDGYLMTCMKMIGINEIKANDGTFTAKLYLERDASVVIDPTKVVPDEYLAPPKPREPSKTLISAAIKAGKVLDFAYIVKNDRLEIK